MNRMKPYKVSWYFSKKWCPHEIVYAYREPWQCPISCWYCHSWNTWKAGVGIFVTGMAGLLTLLWNCS